MLEAVSSQEEKSNGTYNWSRRHETWAAHTVLCLFRVRPPLTRRPAQKIKGSNTNESTIGVECEEEKKGAASKWGKRGGRKGKQISGGTFLRGTKQWKCRPPRHKKGAASRGSEIGGKPVKVENVGGGTRSKTEHRKQGINEKKELNCSNWSKKRPKLGK